MKKIPLLFLFFLIITLGGFAEFSLGVTGSYDFTEELLDAEEIEIDQADLMYGAFAEIHFGKFGLGVQYAVDYFTVFPEEAYNDLRKSNLAAFISLRLFKPRFLIDPFVEGGYGIVMTTGDYPFEMEDTYNYQYVFGGGGVGVNLYFVGVFAKAFYVMPLNGLDPHYRLIMGAKLIF